MPTLTLENLDSLETCQPYLMPFHIDYSGPAPISTYLRVDAANETVGAPPPPQEPSSDAQPTSNSQDAGPAQEPGISIDVPEDKLESDVNLVPEASSSVAKRVTDATTRFISSFRGRTIQGLKVALPEGYVGVVLRGDDASNRDKRGKGVGKKTLMKNEKRATRNRRKVVKDEPESVDDDLMNVEEDGETRTLSIASQFSSFVLWHADHPVDEGRDEYYRSLSEWTRLAHLVRISFNEEKQTLMIV
ncbi:hypothetical protein C0993_010271 [Termitomyces sp. T159_Od127]|nr:hypothetical protein C0993_010271 [Termitomyces sp. T159_Od127]